MSVRLRLTLIYTAVLTLVFLLFGVSVYSRSRSALLDDIDRSLTDIAEQVVNETQAFERGDVTLISFPDRAGSFQSATIFMVAIDSSGDVTPLSDNLIMQDFRRKLDSENLTTENVFAIVNLDGQRLRVLTAPLLIPNEDGSDRLIGYLQIARLLDSYDTALSSLRWTLLFAGWAAVCVSLLLGDLLTHNSLRPLYDITRAAAQITRFDDLSRRVPDPNRRDEIGQLARVLNRTLERLERNFRIQQRFFADVSHELRTPLTTIRGNVDLIRRFGADNESLDAIEEETARMTRLLNDLMFLARADSGALPIKHERVALHDLVFEVFSQVGRLDEKVTLHLGDFHSVWIQGDVDRLKQLVLNLVNNGVKYTPNGGRVTIHVRYKEGQAELAITDTGIGIPEKDLNHIFDRFYRVDKARSRQLGGFGLGTFYRLLDREGA